MLSWSQKAGPYNYQKALYTESTFIYQKALRKHMQGGVFMPCGLLFVLDNKDVYLWQEKVYDPKT